LTSAFKTFEATLFLQQVILSVVKLLLTVIVHTNCGFSWKLYFNKFALGRWTSYFATRAQHKDYILERSVFRRNGV